MAKNAQAAILDRKWPEPIYSGPFRAGDSRSYRGLYSSASPSYSAERQGTYYWNPCFRTDAQGHADIALPELPDSYYIRLEGQTLDGRWFYHINLSRLADCPHRPQAAAVTLRRSLASDAKEGAAWSASLMGNGIKR